MIQLSNGFPIRIKTLFFSGIIAGNNKYTGQFNVTLVLDEPKPLFISSFHANASIEKVEDVLKSNLNKLDINGTKVFGFKDQTHSDSKYNMVAYHLAIANTSKVMIDFAAKNSEQSDKYSITDYEKELNKRVVSFGQEFEQKFELRKKGFNDSEIGFAQSVVSEMVGSVSYYSGNLSVWSPGLSKNKVYGPLQILSGLPSRPVFANPYLWDDGFHNRVIQRWNSQLSLTIIKSWFDLINVEG